MSICESGPNMSLSIFTVTSRIGLFSATYICVTGKTNCDLYAGIRSQRARRGVKTGCTQWSLFALQLRLVRKERHNSLTHRWIICSCDSTVQRWSIVQYRPCEVWRQQSLVEEGYSSLCRNSNVEIRKQQLTLEQTHLSGLNVGSHWQVTAWHTELHH